MQGIYTHILETNYVPREYSVAAILLLLFMVLVSLVSVLNLLYFYISTFRSMCAVSNMAVFCSSLTSWFPGMLFTYFLNDFEIVPVAPIITGIVFVFTFLMRCISIVRSLYFRIFSAFLIHLLLLISVVSLATMLRAGRSGVRIPKEQVFFFQDDENSSGAHTSSCHIRTWVRSWGYSVMSNTHHHLVLRFRMSGAIPLHSVYIFMPWRGKHIPLLYIGS